jgi:hypothetical protein
MSEAVRAVLRGAEHRGAGIPAWSKTIVFAKLPLDRPRPVGKAAL